MIVYLCGPMTGLPKLNVPAFAAAAAHLRAAGHIVVSPHEVSPGEKSWSDHLRADLIAMLRSCDAICLLPGWDTSKGATLERHVAETLGFTILRYEETT